MNKIQSNVVIASMLLSMSSVFFSPVTVMASSHRDAPLISEDPAADATDFYAFISPDKPDTVTLIANYIALEEPAVGSNYRFSDNVLYAIKIDNDGDAQEDITYEFIFHSTDNDDSALLYAPGPIKSLTDPNFHFRQTYTLTKVEHGTRTVLGKDLPVPPVNLGPKSAPNYEALSNATITKLSDGTTVFAGQVDDPFFVDIGSLIDGITIRKLPGNAGGGVDGIAGYNTHALALQIPIQQLTKTKTQIADPKNPDAVIGMWTSAYRKSSQVLKDNTHQNNSGNWIEVSRVGAPLTNDFFIPVVKKDYWNGTEPKDDAQFINYIANPGVAKNIHDIYGIKIPPQGPAGTAEARNDLVTILLTGIPGLNQPAHVVPAEELRLNTAIKPSTSPNRLGVIAGDNQGYPNGRRLADDVIDISLQAAAGVVYPLFVDKNFTPDPLASSLGDGVDGNDKVFRTTFPYLALPWDGVQSVPHGTPLSAKQVIASIKTLVLVATLAIILLALCFVLLMRHSKKATRA